MKISVMFAKIDEALFARSSLGTIRGLLFSTQRRVQKLEVDLRRERDRLRDQALHDENTRLRSKLAEAYGTVEWLKFEAHGRNLGCSEAQHDILKCIAYLGPPTEKELAEDLDLSVGAIHLHLHDLQEFAYVGVNANFRWYLRQHGLRYLDGCGSLPKEGIQID